MSKRGQGAMEYLMTYGWAIIVIMVVGIAMWRLGLFNFGGTPMTSSGFSVLKPMLASCSRDEARCSPSTPCVGMGGPLGAWDEAPLNCVFTNNAGVDIAITDIDVYDSSSTAPCGAVSVTDKPGNGLFQTAPRGVAIYYSGGSKTGTSWGANNQCPTGVSYCLLAPKGSTFLVSAVSCPPEFPGNDAFSGGTTTAITGTPYTMSATITYQVNIGGKIVTKKDTGTIRGSRTPARTQYIDSFSCPYVYVWDGSSYNFVSDINGPGIMALPDYTRTGVNGFYVPDSKDYVIIPEGLMKPDGGKYRVRLAQVPDEVSYTDEVGLWTLDHPPDMEVYSPQWGFMGMDRPEGFKVYTARDEKLPASAIADDGMDVLNKISKVDKDYARKDDGRYYENFTIDLGDLRNAPRIKFIINSKTKFNNEAGFSRPIENTISVKKNGAWVKQNFVVPHGEARIGIVDMTDFLKDADDYVIILSLHYGDVDLDYFAVDTSMDEPEKVLITRYEPIKAILQHTIRITKYYSGNATRYGDVTELLSAEDDKYAIMTLGDHVELEFEQPPAVENGLVRDIMLYTNAYFKNEYAKKALGEQDDRIEPLPFHAMGTYPYNQSAEHYPDDVEHQNYSREYNTRIIA
ncbi:MAG: hypothetical protein NTU61_01825 [Candidatus Altiarchaeota archaeon]|nr:hypothetical protein [Candidatus Altiarchaeota archaeon]